MRGGNVRFSTIKPNIRLGVSAFYFKGQVDMITKPTVLILGAGASSIYDFPTGQGLVSNIISNLRPLSKGETRGKND